MGYAPRKFPFLSNEEFRKLAPAERVEYLKAVMNHLMNRLRYPPPEIPPEEMDDC